MSTTNGNSLPLVCVFVPGIKSTILERVDKVTGKTVVVWPPRITCRRIINVEYLNRPVYVSYKEAAEEGLFLDDLVPRAVIQDLRFFHVNIKDVYGKFMGRLGRMATAACTDFRAFPYDFRLGIAHAAKLLCAYLCDLAHAHPHGFKLKLVGHSFGGFVAYYCLLVYSRDLRAAGVIVDILACIGTPFAGVKETVFNVFDRPTGEALLQSAYGMDIVHTSSAFNRWLSQKKLIGPNDQTEFFSHFQTIFDLMPIPILQAISRRPDLIERNRNACAFVCKTVERRTKTALDVLLKIRPTTNVVGETMQHNIFLVNVHSSRMMTSTPPPPPHIQQDKVAPSTTTSGPVSSMVSRTSAPWHFDPKLLLKFLVDLASLFDPAENDPGPIMVKGDGVVTNSGSFIDQNDNLLTVSPCSTDLLSSMHMNMCHDSFLLSMLNEILWPSPGAIASGGRTLMIDVKNRLTSEATMTMGAGDKDLRPYFKETVRRLNSTGRCLNKDFCWKGPVGRLEKILRVQRCHQQV